MKRPIAPITVADCPQTIRFRSIAHAGEHTTTYTQERATYCWLFSVDPHGAVGRRYINANDSPFAPIKDDQTKTVGYLCKLDTENGTVKYAGPASPCPVTEARLEMWLDAGILVDPN